jgi:hypothetical protein
MSIRSYISRTIHSLLEKNKTSVSANSCAHSDRIIRRTRHALALKPRGGIRNDVLVINRLAMSVHVEWFARDVHPWDSDLPERRKAELFAQQCLEDVDAAIPRLFEQLPEIDVLEIEVLERASKNKIIGGVVHRSDLGAQVGSSLGMRLKTIGINYRCEDLRLEPIA